MKETHTSNNFLQNGIKQLFAEVPKKTHLDEENLNDWIKVEIQNLIEETYKKKLSERVKLGWQKRKAKEQARTVLVKVEGE